MANFHHWLAASQADQEVPLFLTFILLITSWAFTTNILFGTSNGAVLSHLLSILELSRNYLYLTRCGEARKCCRCQSRDWSHSVYNVLLGSCPLTHTRYHWNCYSKHFNAEVLHFNNYLYIFLLRWSLWTTITKCPAAARGRTIISTWTEFFFSVNIFY